jgi:parallel beta-helix repeat protein
MLLRNRSRALLRSSKLAARRRRQLQHLRPCAAEVLESRVLLAATLLVDPASTNPAVFHTIQSAVNAAASGDTIKVAAATYNENVTVSKSLTILGGQVLMPGESGPSTVEYETTGFTVSSANKVTIKGFTIESDLTSTTSTELGILATNSASSKFDNNVLVVSGIELDGGVTHTEVAHNSDSVGGRFAILVLGNRSSNADDTILDNTLSFGFLSLDASATGALVAGNTVTNGGNFALFSNAANNVTFVGNTAENGNIVSLHTIGFDDSGNNNTYIGNTAQNNVGTGFLLSGTGLILIGNIANDNFGNGIEIPAGTATLLFNTANNNRGTGIFVLSPGFSTVIGNVANENHEAGFVISLTSGAIIGNVAENDGLDGFRLNVTQSTVSANTANNNGDDGIQLRSGTDNTLSLNTANNNGADGIEVDDVATGNTLSNNTALGNAVVDLFDESTGSGTAGTANTWTNNTANTSNPVGLL